MAEMGRPPLPEDQRRNQKLPVRVSRDEVQAVRDSAARAGLGVTEWVRQRLGLDDAPKRETVEPVTELTLDTDEV